MSPTEQGRDFAIPDLERGIHKVLEAFSKEACNIVNEGKLRF